MWRDRAGLAVRERLPLWLQSRCGLERRSVAALTVLLVVAAAFAYAPRGPQRDRLHALACLAVLVLLVAAVAVRTLTLSG